MSEMKTTDAMANPCSGSPVTTPTSKNSQRQGGKPTVNNIPTTPVDKQIHSTPTTRANVTPVDKQIHSTPTTRANVTPVDKQIHNTPRIRANVTPVDKQIHSTPITRANVTPVDKQIHSTPRSRAIVTPLEKQIHSTPRSRAIVTPLEKQIHSTPRTRTNATQQDKHTNSMPNARRSVTPSDRSTYTTTSITMPDRQTNSTPNNQTSATQPDRLTHSTLRTPHFRPALLTSQSLPLTRSMSMRVSKKERRWSERLADPMSPIITTYKDDYQPPDELSYKMRSLNLATLSEVPSGSTPNLFTTYQDSFQWPCNSQAASAPLLTSVSSIQQRGNSSTASRHTASSKSPVMTSAGTTNHKMLPSPAADSMLQRPLIQRNDSQPEKESLNGDQSFRSTSRSTSLLSKEDSMPMKTGVSRSVMTKPLYGNGDSADSTGKVAKYNGSAQTAHSSHLPNGTAVSSSSTTERTPQRTRAYQLHSSHGGNPFVYGSDSASWL